MKTSNRYQVIVVDVGIFWRYYKWIYNPIIRIPGSTTTSYILGFWHTYKELCQIIYSKSIKYFFGPIFGQLYSEANILLKPKLGVLEYYFTWLMLAYPFIKDKLYEFISKSQYHIKSTLKNIKFLFESAIPFVCHYFISIF